MRRPPAADGTALLSSPAEVARNTHEFVLDDGRHALTDRWLGWSAVGLRLGLGALTAVLAIIAVAPGLLSGFGRGSVTGEGRLALIAATVVVGSTAVLLDRRLRNTTSWVSLPDKGSLTVSREGLVVRHEGVLGEALVLAWPSVRVVALDTGARHDRPGGRWRRFPLMPRKTDRQNGRGRRRYLVGVGGRARPGLALLATLPVAPTVAVILEETVRLHNPKVDTLAVTFPGSPDGSIPAVPPGATTDAWGILLPIRHADLDRLRQVLRPTKVMRAIRASDLPTLR